MTRILIVDDEESIRVTLETFLLRDGFEVETAGDVETALRLLRAGSFDVVVSDIIMPRITGVELLQSIRKESPRVQVIMMTGQPTLETAAAAVRAGAFDYLFKPVPKDVILRSVANAAKLKATEDERERLQRELEQHNIRLEETVRLRTQQLADANARLSILDKAKSDFLGLISHELRTPMCGLYGVADLLIAACPKTPETEELVEVFEESRQQLLSIVEDALLLASIEVNAEKFSQETTPLGLVLQQAAEKAAVLARSRHVRLDPVPEDARMIRGETKLFARAIQALLETAVKFSHPEEAVRIAIQPAETDVMLLIEARRRTIPAGALPKFFQVFSIKDAITPGGDLGLGPPVAERIISLFGGGVSVENLDPPGMRLTIRLKTAK
ncbi:MAG: response regulator [Verrucomicrobia bacterium]|nr:response regulator [Verrucomicrobiota bacterium]